MALIAIAEAQPGMTLADDVKDRQERLLVRAGTVLTDQHITSLTGRGVAMLSIEAEARPNEDGSLPDDPAARERAAKVEAYFDAAGIDHPFVEALRTSVVRAVTDGAGGW